MSMPRVQMTAATATKMRKARESLGITQAEVARRAKVPRARVKRIEGQELATIDEGEYGRLLVALGITKKRKPASKQGTPKMRARAARALLEKHGLLDVTLGELLRG